MKNLGPVIAATLWATSAATAMAGTNGGEAVNGINRGGVELLVVGPVEAIDQAAKTAVILGQRVLVADANHLALGETAAVFGTARSDGSIVAAAIQSRGPYVPGASASLYLGCSPKVRAISRTGDYWGALDRSDAFDEPRDSLACGRHKI